MSIRNFYFAIIVFTLIGSGNSFAQEAECKEEYSTAIEDNSMLIEEAYNQEDRVVQHISNFTYASSPSKDFMYAFTQEWPAFGLKHQLSYTVPYYSLSGGTFSGIGDVMLNYRYQLTYKDAWATIAPRISLVLPTGAEDKGLGTGGVGAEFNLPISKRISESFVTHVNVGARYNSRIQDKVLSFDGSTTNFFAGISGIWLVTQNFNVMLETLTNFEAVPIGADEVEYVNETVVAPGLRGAIDIGDLQIVPGFAVPISYSSENTDARTSMFFYLSFEHPF